MLQNRRRKQKTRKDLAGAAKRAKKLRKQNVKMVSADAKTDTDRPDALLDCRYLLKRSQSWISFITYRRTENLRAVQLLLGHTKLESTVRYLGIEVDDAFAMAEQTEV
jgi:hypothetical protein